MRLRLATRGSPLALAQTELVSSALRHADPAVTVEVVVVRTHGDRDRHSPLSAIGGQGVFVDGVRSTILEGRADAAVHSFKDVPTALVPALVIEATLERADPRDVFVGARPADLDRLAAGARLGTSSRRRTAMLAAWRPDVDAVSIRGNVETRIGAIARGECDGVLLAAAGLARLGTSAGAVEVRALPLDRFLPSPGQGVVAVECRADDAATRGLLRRIDHAETHAAAAAERAFMGVQDAGCTLPIGAYARIWPGRIHLRGTLDGAPASAVEADGPVGDAERLGRELGERARGELAGVPR